jgi:hypothetical protein
LSLGKLTGKLEKGNDKARMTNDEGLQNSSLVIRPSSFVIHTPTATVTDLGTEFGVEVRGQDAVQVVVFDGAVKVADSRQQTSRLAKAGEAIEVRAGIVSRVKPRNTVDKFVRAIPSGKSAGPRRTGIVFSYDFERPSLVPGNLLGQDGWISTWWGPKPSLVVGPGTGVNHTQVIGGRGYGDFANYRPFKWARQWIQIAAGMVATQEFWVCAATPENTDVVMGATWAGGGNQGGGLFGISQGTWYIRRPQSPGITFTGDGGIKPNHWYVVRLDIDFSVSGGLATLYRRDATAGETAFTEDSRLRAIAMEVPHVPWEPPEGQYEISGISTRPGCNNVGPFYLDNYSIRVEAKGLEKPAHESQTTTKTGAITP